MNWHPEFIHSPKRARPFFYRIDFIWLIPIIGACSYFLYPYGLLSLLLVPLTILLGIWQHKTAGYMIDGKQLTMQYRVFNRITFFYGEKNVYNLLKVLKRISKKRKKCYVY